MARKRRLYIGGAWAAPQRRRRSSRSSRRTPRRSSPGSPAAGPADVDRAVAAARAAVDDGPWPRLDPAERIDAVRRLADALRRAPHARWPQLITAEMGAPDLVLEAAPRPRCRGAMLSAFADIADGPRVGGDPRPATTGRTCSCARSRSAWSPPSCRGTCRSSSIVGEAGPGAAGRLRRRAQAGARDAARRPAAGRAGRRARPARRASSASCPAAREVGAHLVGHPGVDKVSFTGSTAAGPPGRRRLRRRPHAGEPRAGRQVGRHRARRRRPRRGRRGRQGRRAHEQRPGLRRPDPRSSCPPSRYDEIVDALAAMVDGARRRRSRATAATEIGPLVARRQQERVRDYIDGRPAARAPGSSSAAPTLPDGVDRGWYVRPTLFADVDNGMRIAREEIFGPVLVGDPVRRRRRRGPHRQRLRLRAVGLGVDRRRRPGPRRSPAGSAPVPSASTSPTAWIRPRRSAG